MIKSLSFKRDFPQLPKDPTKWQVAVFLAAWLTIILTIIGLIVVGAGLVVALVAGILLIPACMIFVLVNWIMPFVGIPTAATFAQCFVGSIGLAVLANIIRFFWK